MPPHGQTERKVPAGAAQPRAPARPARSPTGIVPPPSGAARGNPAGPARGYPVALQRPARPARRWQLAGLIIAIVLLAGALGGMLLTRHPAGPHLSAAGPGSGLIAGETAIRGEAVSWITEQVDHNIAMACDAVMCSDLAQQGFPAGNLNVLPPTAPDPYGSELLIATADVRSQFASRLAFYAPTVIASFGSGPARIDVRVIASNGAAYQAALRRDLHTRKSSGAELAGNEHVTSTPAARARLLSGEVDIRLLTALAFLASQEPVSIVAFGSFAPGAAAGVPLRWAYLAESDPAARQHAPAYLKSLITFARNLRPPYAPLDVAEVTLSPGHSVLRIEFAAPSPLGLIPS